MPEQQREIGSILARLEAVERESQRQRDRLHELETATATLGLLLQSVKDLRELCNDVPVLRRDVLTLSNQVKTMNRGFWALVMALVSASVAFAFFAVQIALG